MCPTKSVANGLQCVMLLSYSLKVTLPFPMQFAIDITYSV